MPFTPPPIHPPPPRSDTAAALRIVAVYAIVSALWIGLSDTVVAWLFRDAATITQVSTIKGWLFVAVTSLLLFGLIRRLSAGLQRTVATLQQREAELRNSEHELLEAQTLAGLGSYALDVQTGLWTSSVVCDQLFGIDADYVRSVTGWVELVHPDDRAHMAQYFQVEVLQKGQAFD